MKSTQLTLMEKILNGIMESQNFKLEQWNTTNEIKLIIWNK